MEKNLNWAVLGTGVIANEMAQALKAIEENTTIEILCIVESGTEQEAARIITVSSEIPSTTVYRELL